MKNLLQWTITAAILFWVADSFGAEGDRLVAVLNPTAGSVTKGVVSFEQGASGVKVKAIITGLKPNSKHGFHIHQYGDMSAMDAKSAGGHFNPDGNPHALPSRGKARHAGDLGNIVTDEAGVGVMSVIVSNFTLHRGPSSILGRAIVVHADADDGSQPKGNAGARIASGVIGYQNADTDAFSMIKDVPNRDRYLIILTTDRETPIEEVGEAVEDVGEAVSEGVEDVIKGVGKAIKKAVD